ncbi:MAG: hypothetical protein JHC33_08945 [Ignisphaera sp.]|nr:hypothetical protein [Ignisphaera sp.]
MNELVMNVASTGQLNRNKIRGLLLRLRGGFAFETQEDELLAKALWETIKPNVPNFYNLEHMTFDWDISTVDMFRPILREQWDGDYDGEAKMKGIFIHEPTAFTKQEI